MLNDIDCVVKISDKNKHYFHIPRSFSSSNEIIKLAYKLYRLKKNRWKCNKHLLKCSGWSFPLFLSPLANLSVNLIHGHRNSNFSPTVDMFNATLFRSFFANILFCFSFFVFTEIFTLFLLYNRVLTFLWQKHCSTFFSLHHPFCTPYHFNHSQGFFYFIFFFFGGGGQTLR